MNTYLVDLRVLSNRLGSSGELQGRFCLTLVGCCDCGDDGGPKWKGLDQLIDNFTTVKASRPHLWRCLVKTGSSIAYCGGFTVSYLITWNPQPMNVFVKMTVSLKKNRKNVQIFLACYFWYQQHIFVPSRWESWNLLQTSSSFRDTRGQSLAGTIFRFKCNERIENVCHSRFSSGVYSFP